MKEDSNFLLSKNYIHSFSMAGHKVLVENIPKHLGIDEAAGIFKNCSGFRSFEFMGQKGAGTAVFDTYANARQAINTLGRSCLGFITYQDLCCGICLGDSDYWMRCKCGGRVYCKVTCFLADDTHQCEPETPDCQCIWVNDPNMAQIQCACKQRSWCSRRCCERDVAEHLKECSLARKDPRENDTSVGSQQEFQRALSPRGQNATVVVGQSELHEDMGRLFLSLRGHDSSADVQRQMRPGDQMDLAQLPAGVPEPRQDAQNGGVKAQAGPSKANGERRLQ